MIYEFHLWVIKKVIPICIPNRNQIGMTSLYFMRIEKNWNYFLTTFSI